MPRRDDLHKILLIGSGPIIIGQACEFDYSGTQACKALREEGYEVVLVNSNPATIMTDPETADRTYIEPSTWEIVAKVIEAERPDALLPTLGGQTGLNTAMDLHKHGVLEKYGVEMIGAKPDVIAKAEDRDQFKAAMDKIGLEVCRGQRCSTHGRGPPRAGRSGCPASCGPALRWAAPAAASPTTATNSTTLVNRGLELSPVHEVLIEESVIGWKEYEMEVMRDADDNVVIICSIENFDPMGVHTGDSITVAPAQTLSDKEYQRMRDASLAVIREIGVETGGSNIQFAIDPKTGRMIVIEMNPRVSRSTRWPRKPRAFPSPRSPPSWPSATGCTNCRNDITRETTACFEPTIDYVVTKIPRFAFEKFPEADPTLTTQMKSVGETMAIGRTFKESFQKALRGLEVGRFGFGCDGKDLWGTPQQPSRDEIKAKLATPNAERIWYLRYAMKSGHVDRGNPRHHAYRPLVPGQPAGNRRAGRRAARCGRTGRTRRRPRCCGPSRPASPTASCPPSGAPTRWTSARDARAAASWPFQDRRHLRRRIRGLHAVLLFDLRRPKTKVRRAEDDARHGKRDHDSRRRAEPHRPGDRVRLLLLPGRFALRETGFETIMVNSNPETVSAPTTTPATICSSSR